MIGLIHHLLRDERRCAHAFDCRHASRALAWPVHAAGIELHDAVRIRQAAVADARLFGIELDDIDARDQCIEHVAPLRHHRKRLLDARHLTAVLELVAVCGGDHDGLDALLHDHGGRLRKSGGRGGSGKAGSAGQHEFPASHFVSHECKAPRAYAGRSMRSAECGSQCAIRLLTAQLQHASELRSFSPARDSTSSNCISSLTLSLRTATITLRPMTTDNAAFHLH